MNLSKGIYEKLESRAMVLFGFGKKSSLPTPDQALPGRAEEMPVPSQHYVLGNPLKPPFPESMEMVIFGMGCFWGAERKFWQLEGVYTTAVGYAAGITPNPTYKEVCSGMTGHNEVVLVVYDPKVINYSQLLKVFGKITIPLKECVRVTMLGLNIVREFMSILKTTKN